MSLFFAGTSIFQLISGASQKNGDQPYQCHGSAHDQRQDSRQKAPDIASFGIFAGFPDHQPDADCVKDKSDND